MSKQKVKMVTAILILLYSAKRGLLIDMLKKPQNTHSQELRIGVSQKYHPKWYFLMRPVRMIVTAAPAQLDWTSETRAMLSFMSRPKDIKNAKLKVMSGVSETGSTEPQFKLF